MLHTQSSFFKKASAFMLAPILVGLTAGLLGLGSLSVESAGVNPTITPSTANVSTATSIDVTFTAVTAIASGGNIKLIYPDTYTGTVSTANTTVQGAAPSSVNNVSSSGYVTSTLVLGSAITANTSVTVSTSALTTPSSAGNYDFSIVTSGGDSGANFQYVGQANVVQVRAFVPTSLSFVIRNSDDTANTNVCDLGILSTTSVGSCAYRLKVGTNASSGYVISVSSSGNLTNGTTSFTNAATGSNGSGGTNIVAATETYGVNVTKGSTTSGAATTLAAVYNAGNTNSVSYVNTSAATLLSSAGTNAPATSGDTANTALVTHNAAISSNTGAGEYTQTVTYTVAPSF
jgi:hypothetical protein